MSALNTSNAEATNQVYKLIRRKDFTIYSLLEADFRSEHTSKIAYVKVSSQEVEFQ